MFFEPPAPRVSTPWLRSLPLTCYNPIVFWSFLSLEFHVLLQIVNAFRRSLGSCVLKLADPPGRISERSFWSRGRGNGMLLCDTNIASGAGCERSRRSHSLCSSSLSTPVVNTKCDSPLQEQAVVRVSVFRKLSGLHQKTLHLPSGSGRKKGAPRSETHLPRT